MGAPYYGWDVPDDMPDYFISGPQNFTELFTGTQGSTSDRSGIAPLGPIPQVLGVLPLGAPLQESEQEVKASIPWRLAKLGAIDAWAGRRWSSPPRTSSPTRQKARSGPRG